MKEVLEFPRRAESLNIYKPKTIQLPRFHSKPKNHGEANRNAIKVEVDNSSRSGKSKLTPYLNKAQVTEMFTKIKERKNQIKGRKDKVLSEKKITVRNAEASDEKTDRVKINFKSRQAPGNLVLAPREADNELNKRHQFTTERVNHKTPKQFRSKSLKNAVKITDPLVSMEQASKRSIEVKKKLLTEAKAEKVRKHKPSMIEYNNEITTEATQSGGMCDMDKKIWMRIIEIMRNITIQPGLLDWPEEYIVMDKIQAERRLLVMLEESNMGPKLKEKARKNICVTRVIMYLYAGLILHDSDCRSLLKIFDRLCQSYSKIIEGVLAGVGFSPDRLGVVSRNNDFNTKALVQILTKKSIPQGNLLRSMLESSLKMESLEFIQILDKTLKWEILKMPSYPYLPASQKELFLVLDLDETLIHYDYTSEVFHVRPLTEEFLKKCSKLYEIIIFTAAVQEYADEILEEIDPDHCISYKLYRNHLTYIDNSPVKDLSMLGRPLNKTLLVDNLAVNFRLQPENGIHIRSWYDDDDDEALGKLYGLLLKISEQYREDVRVGVREMSRFVREEITKADLIYELKKEL